MIHYHQILPLSGPLISPGDEPDNPDLRVAASLMVQALADEVPTTPAARMKAANYAARAANAERVLRSLNITAEGQDALEALEQGGESDAQEIAGWAATGMAERLDDGSYALTPAGRMLLRAARMGDRGRVGALIARERQRLARRRDRDEQRKPVADEPDRTGAISAAIRGKSTLTVFKDARGTWRWLSVTTTAFQDRDREIISRAALKADVERADRDGLYGPLRYWHVGRPNPRHPTAPWGPGIDLGWCDFNAVSQSGLSLIESGTFKSERIARLVAAKADQLEMSPGFFHLAGTPGPDGVYTNIRRFERSIVPRWAGRASNLYTRFAAQGVPMDEAKLKALQGLGFSATDLRAFADQVEATEKAAREQTAFKSAGQPATITIAGQTFALTPVEPQQATVKEEPQGEAELDEEQYISDMTVTDFQQLIGNLLKPAVTEQPTAKSAAAAPAAMSSTGNEIAALKSEFDSLKAQLAQLIGEQPRAVSRATGQRPTEDALNAVRQKAAQNGIDTTDPLGSVKQALFGGQE